MTMRESAFYSFYIENAQSELNSRQTHINICYIHSIFNNK